MFESAKRLQSPTGQSRIWPVQGNQAHQQLVQKPFTDVIDKHLGAVKVHVQVIKKAPAAVAPRGRVFDVYSGNKGAAPLTTRPAGMRRYDTSIIAAVPHKDEQPRGQAMDIQPIRQAASAQPIAPSVANKSEQPVVHILEHARQVSVASLLEVAQAPISTQEKKRSKFRTFLPVAGAMAILIIGAGVFVTTYLLNKQAIVQVAHAASQNTGGDQAGDDNPPSEQPVSASAVGSYRVAPDMAQTVTIEKFKLTARIKRMTVLKDGSLSAPNNVNDAGWYEGSSKPGEGGAVLLDGHVHGPTLPGTFYYLKDLVAGDKISITRGDGTKFTYQVVKKAQVPSGQVDMSSLLLPVTPGKAGLNLMTCGGKYLPKEQTYQDRVLIYAEQI
jgi:sortase (surface protein transpeptidase)